jgi:uncharacterized protein (TIGR00730 family)
MSGMGPILSVCVFCGSSSGNRPEYTAVARELGTLLATRGIGLVYGGGHVGMMGHVADAALAAGGSVVGVIPEHLMRPEVAHQRLTELLVVESMHVRKRTMAGRADAFIVLPGGYGTFEEMFEMVTWLQLQLHAKPVGVVNGLGYFDALLVFLRHAAAEGFIRPQHRELLSVGASPAQVLDALVERRARAARPNGDLNRS